MRVRRVKRIWHGKATLRDYEVEKFIKEGGVILECNVNGKIQTMTLTPDQLLNCYKVSTGTFSSKYSPGLKYNLVDYLWRDDKEVSTIKQEQLSFI